MKIGIMQPYFFPYLGYYALIQHTDIWVVFDTPQFMRHSWIERNRIVEPTNKWQYIKVPLEKHKRETPINEIRIKNINWQDKIIAQLTHYKQIAPNYNVVKELIQEAISYKTESISILNTFILDLRYNHV